MTDSAAWEKRFRQHTPIWFVILFGLIVAGIGAFLIVLDRNSWMAGKPSGVTWAGLGAVVLGPTLAWLMWHFRTDTDIVCTPDGFTLVKETRKGKTEEPYLWTDVTATKYWETTSHNKEKNTTTVTSWYKAEGPSGESLFQVPGSIGNFDELIQVFNDRAVSVPYLWLKQFGFNLSLAGMKMDRSRYAQVPRGAATPAQAPS